MRFASHITVLALVAAAASAAGAQTHSTTRHYKETETTASSPELARAEDALSHNDFGTAEPLLQKVVQSDPRNYVAWFDLGFLYNATYRKLEAVAAFRRSVDANPEIFESNFQLGLALASTGDAEAAKFLRAATRLKPAANPQQGLERTWMALGQVLEARDAAGAVAAYREAAKIDATSVTPHVAAAAVLQKSGDLAGAEAEFRAALGIDPKSGDALSGLVNVYVAQRKLPEAEATLRQMTAADPANGAAHAQLARILAAEGRDADAAVELEAAMKSTPADPAALRALAGIHATAKQYDKAAAEYRELITRDPKDAQAHFALGTVLMQQHRFEEAQAEFLVLVKLTPNDAEAFSSLAFAAAANKQYGRAIQAINAHAQLAGESPGTYYLRATAYDNLHDWVHAAENYRAFLDTTGKKTSDEEWKARHRLIAIDPDNKTEKKKK